MSARREANRMANILGGRMKGEGFCFLWAGEREYIYFPVTLHQGMIENWKCALYLFPIPSTWGAGNGIMALKPVRISSPDLFSKTIHLSCFIKIAWHMKKLLRRRPAADGRDDSKNEDANRCGTALGLCIFTRCLFFKFEKKQLLGGLDVIQPWPSGG